MKEELYKDLKANRQYEILVMDRMEQELYGVVDVSTDKTLCHKGDMWGVVNYDDCGYMVEVKADTRIHATGNLFVETEVKFNDGTRSKGWYYNDYEVIAYVDVVGQIVYMIDWERMRTEMQLSDCRKVISRHADNIVGGVIVSLGKIRHNDWIMYTWTFSTPELQAAKRKADREELYIY